MASPLRCLKAPPLRQRCSPPPPLLSPSLPPSLPQIIKVNLTSQDARPLTPGAKLDFTYSVRWVPTRIPFAKRFERYLDYSFFEHQVRGGGGEKGASEVGHAMHRNVFVGPP